MSPIRRFLDNQKLNDDTKWKQEHFLVIDKNEI